MFMKFHVQNRWAKLGEKVGELGKYDQRIFSFQELFSIPAVVDVLSRQRMGESAVQLLADFMCR